MQSNSLPDSAPRAERTSDSVELALCLAGGVSASCWTAGVLDYLGQALDAWEAERDRNPGDAPPHRVVLAALAGASGGAECAALWVPYLRTVFPPADADYQAAPGQNGHNPLHDGWVDGADASQLLDTRDGSDRIFRSLLDGGCTDRIANRNLDKAAQQPQRAPRAWVAEPLRVRFAITHLEGTPLRWPSAAGVPDRALRLHADHLSFCIRDIGGTPASPGSAVAHDEQPLAWPSNPRDLSQRWTGFMQAAAASGAFPVLLPLRTTAVAAGHWQPTRPPLRSEAGSRPAAAAFEPLWAPSPARDAPLPITAADGGVLNNVPLNLAESALAHLGAPGPGAGPPPWQAVLVIDPAPPRPSPQAVPAAAVAARPAPLRWLAMLAGAVWQHARTSPREAVADMSPAGMRRFVLVPSGAETRPGQLPLAGLALGGFAGYLDRGLREHDFQRGRADARRWLTTGLTLPEDHPVFARWRAAQRDRHRVKQNGSWQLPLIPLTQALQAAPQAMPEWPRYRDRMKQVREQMPRRLDAVVEGLLHAYLPRRFIVRMLAVILWRWILGPRICKVLLARCGRQLSEAGL